MTTESVNQVMQSLSVAGENVRSLGAGPQPQASQQLRRSYLEWIRNIEKSMRALVPEVTTAGLYGPRYTSILEDRIPTPELAGVINAEIDHQLTWLRQDRKLANSSRSMQANYVRAWIELERKVPRLVVANDSSGPIRFIQPTVYLIAHPNGAVVGGPIQAVAELSPTYSFVWELRHFSTWAREPSVVSQVHVQFTDERGQRWQLGHGTVAPIPSIDPNSMLYLRGVAARSETEPIENPTGLVGSGEQVAFISYVHEDTKLVDELQRELEAAGVAVWRDRDQLLPGDDLRARIREAIETRTFAFVPCFSASYGARERTVMNEELAIAVDEVRLRSDARWFIPVRLTDCTVPDLDLGQGRRLRNLVWADLGHDWTGEMRRLIAAVQRRA